MYNISLGVKPLWGRLTFAFADDVALAGYGYNIAGPGLSLLWGRGTFAIAATAALGVSKFGVSLLWGRVTFALVAAVALQV